MSVAFTKEGSAETASETLLPDRPVSPHPNLVTEAGLKALEFQLHQAREAYETAQKIEDVNERRRQAAIPLRDMRYFAARVRTAQVITNPASTDTVAFGSTVTFRRDDGRVQKYRIVGEDEADPKAGSISFVSPVARLLLGKAVGDEVGASSLRLFRSHSRPHRTQRRSGHFAPEAVVPVKFFWVESRCGAVALCRTYLLPPLSSGGALVVPPWLRFHIPLIEPDRQISRIRLSDKTSRFRVQRHLQLLNIHWS